MRGNVYKLCNCRNPETGKKLGKDCPKRGKKCHGQWWGRYTAPPGVDGKRRRPWIGPFNTRDEAEGEVTEAASKVGRGEPVGNGRILVSSRCDTWLAGKKMTLKPSTYASYEEAVRLYIRPGLGHLRLADVRDHHITELVTAMTELNRPLPDGGKPSEMLRRLLEVRAGSEKKNHEEGQRKQRAPLSAARIQREAAVWNVFFNDAVKAKLISYNPAQHATLPRTKRSRPLVWTEERVERWKETGKAPGKVMVWSPAQTGGFLDYVVDERLYALFHLTAFRGLRRAEVIGLPWSETNLEAGTITIRETRPNDEDSDEAKSESGERTVTLDANTVSVMKAWRKRQAAERLAWGPAWTDTGLVFSREDGTPLRGEHVSERFTTFARRASLPPIRFHDLRHGSASLSLAAGVDLKIVSENLGHSRHSFTADVYTTVVPEIAQEAAEAAAAIVPRTKGGAL